MSVRVMNEVWTKSKQKGTALLLLLAIADFANDDGVAWPAVPTLAEKIRMTERYTHNLLASLAQSGELGIEANAGPHHTNLYRLCPGGEAGFTLKRSSGVKRGSERGEAGFRGGVRRGSPEPSVNHQEPSVARKARPRDELFDAVVEVCQADTKLQGSTVGKVTAQLRAAGYSAADVRAFGVDWWAWKDRVKPPTVWKLRDTISQVKATSKSNSAPVVPRILTEEV